MGRGVAVLTVLLATWSSAPTVLCAQEEPSEEPTARHEESGEHADESHAEGHHHKNEVALVIGGTYKSEERETLFTLGAEYVRKLSPVLSTTIVLEHLSDVDAWVFAAPLRIEPWEHSGFFFSVGPGFEHESERGESEDLFLWRTGIGYNLRLGEKLTLSPGLNVDFVREDGEWVEATVLDIALGLGF